MNRSSWVAAVAGALAFVVGTIVPASAQYENEYIPPKLLTRGTTSSPVVGGGTVVVQVEVNADGSRKVIKVIRSSNPRNDKAALDIAGSSTYRPATRGGKPVTAFYDYTLNFSEVGNGGGKGVGRIVNLNRIGNYTAAKEAAQEYLAAHPGDADAEQQLGIASYFLNDIAGAITAFDHVSKIDPNYRVVASHAYAAAAVGLATTSQPDPAQAVADGRKALALDDSANSYYSLGFAQVIDKDFAGAQVSLAKARSLAFKDKHTNMQSRLNLDAALLQAYLGTNDTADANRVAAEMKRVDPSSTTGAQILGQHYLAAGLASMQSKQYTNAIAQFAQAASAGSPDVQITAYAQSAFSVANEPSPDYNVMKSYADKALAVKSDDASANYAEGVALAGLYASNHKQDVKKESTSYLNKALQYAQAANNAALVAQIQAFVKNMPK